MILSSFTYRPVLWINTLGPATIGMGSRGFRTGRRFGSPLAHAAFNLLIYGVNDVFDQETDARNPRKGPWKGQDRRSEVRLIVLGVILSNVPFLIYFDPGLALFGDCLDAPLRAGLRRLSTRPRALQSSPYLDS